MIPIETKVKADGAELQEPPWHKVPRTISSNFVSNEDSDWTDDGLRRSYEYTDDGPRW